MTLAMRPYQLEALEAIEQSGVRQQLVALPTGTGKTVVFSELIRRRGGSALVLAHRDELLEQATKKIAQVAPELAIGIGRVQAERNDTHAPVVVASVQTLARQKRLDQLPRDFKTVIVDEAHHSTADSYLRVLEHVEDAELVVGWTATPERSDKGRLIDVFPEVVYARSLEQMIREGWLCDLRALRVELADLDLGDVKKSRGDFQADDLGRALEQADAVEHAVGAYMEHAKGRRTIVFLPTVQLAHEASAAFREAGVAAAHVDAETPRDERRELLEDFSTGKVEVVANVGVLTEGFDEPAVDCVLIAAPTKSRVRYVQMVGRGTRIYPGKSDCLILDLVGSTEHSIQSVHSIFGLPDPPEEDETITEAVDRVAEEQAQSAADEAERKKAKRKASRADLFNRDLIHWLHVGDRWLVGLGDGHLVLDRQGESWRVILLGKEEQGDQVLVDNLDLGYAQGVAEQVIRDQSSIQLANREAPWRKQPASDGQYRFLRRLGQPVSGIETKGQAADAITLALAVKRLWKFDAAESDDKRSLVV